MPTQDYKAPNASLGVAAEHQTIVCPPLLTPPPDDTDLNDPVRPADSLGSHDGVQDGSTDRVMYMNNNTAAAMALSQEESMYLTPSISPDSTFLADHASDLAVEDKMEIIMEENAPIKSGTTMGMLDAPPLDETVAPPSPRSLPSISPRIRTADHKSSPDLVPITNHGVTSTTGSVRHVNDSSPRDHDRISIAPSVRPEAVLSKGAKVDQELDWTAGTATWDFSEKRLEPRYPSAMFQCNSQYEGTQQSDRQVYNVNVRILTVDMDQCSCTGYLTIKGLTPEHDTLQTYFTGEIIGGPDQRYSFRTKTSEWGASDKTDRIHWARFPAWRTYTAHAKKNLDFEYPPMGENWWQQECIFMRWKEHFLVPDHKTKSIAGASFEGFYYICLNQVEGRISGIYFHSKSEKYQQLELKHEGNDGIWHQGVTPSIEFR